MSITGSLTGFGGGTVLAVSGLCNVVGDRITVFVLKAAKRAQILIIVVEGFTILIDASVLVGHVVVDVAANLIPERSLIESAVISDLGFRQTEDLTLVG